VDIRLIPYAPFNHPSPFRFLHVLDSKGFEDCPRNLTTLGNLGANFRFLCRQSGIFNSKRQAYHSER